MGSAMVMRSREEMMGRWRWDRLLLGWVLKLICDLFYFAVGNASILYEE